MHVKSPHDSFALGFYYVSFYTIVFFKNFLYSSEQWLEIFKIFSVNIKKILPKIIFMIILYFIKIQYFASLLCFRVRL